MMPSASARGDVVVYCTRCLMPSSRPRVGFDADGVCNACRHAERKRDVDWDARRAEFLRLLDEHRSTDGRWDCVVPWSGGKDSSTIAHRLKFELGMNPLLVTFSPLIPNDVGHHNREAFQRLGFDGVMVRPNQDVARRLARRFFVERGNLKVAWDAGINAVPVTVALKYGIKLVVYAEHGESEYGGRVLHEESQKFRDYTEVIEHQIGDDPHNWTDDAIRIGDLQPYLYPSPDELGGAGLRACYFGYFFRWSMYENYRYIRDTFEFRTNAKGRTDGTFTAFDSLDDKTDDVYYYLQWIKFGFGRAVRDASRMIQNGHMTREEGLALALKYDGEFPMEFLDDCLEYLGVDRAGFEAVADQHRNPEIWERDGAAWRLRFPLR
jgi:N-acetyl sugar amidotransferase